MMIHTALINCLILVAEGSLGKKTGRGIYDWTEGEKSEREDLPS